MTNDTIQYPNIISDIDNLNLIFTLLKKEHVWYATCDEVANYFIDRNNTKVKINTNSFKLLSDKSLNSEITLTLPYKGEILSLYNEKNQFIKTFILNKQELYITYPFQINKLYKIKDMSEN